MDLSTEVNIVLCIMSFILAVFSLIFVVLTIKQNSQLLKQNALMIENSTRPYVTIYFDYSQMGDPTGYFVVKNFGTSSAIIDSIKYNDPIKNHPATLANLPAIFDGLVGNSIAPNQKFFTPFKVYEYVGGITTFDITYHVEAKSYSEHVEISVENYGKLVKSRLSSKEYKAISYPLQEIAERLM